MRPRTESDGRSIDYREKMHPVRSSGNADWTTSYDFVSEGWVSARVSWDCTDNSQGFSRIIYDRKRIE